RREKVPPASERVAEQGQQVLGLDHDVAVVVSGVVDESDRHQRQRERGKSRVEVDSPLAEEDDGLHESDENEQKRRGQQQQPKRTDEKAAVYAHRQPYRTERDREIGPG